MAVTALVFEKRKFSLNMRYSSASKSRPYQKNVKPHSPLNEKLWKMRIQPRKQKPINSNGLLLDTHQQATPTSSRSRKMSGRRREHPFNCVA